MANSRNSDQAAPSGAVLLQQIGRALCGERWHSDLARLLDVDRMTVTRWVTGSMQPRRRQYAKLRDLLVDRIAELHQLYVAAQPYAEGRAPSGTGANPLGDPDNQR
jgi:hypothetical protein